MAIVFAQLGTAGISGQVLDTNGAAVPSARVVVIAEVFNLFNVTNIRGVYNVIFSGFQNTLLRDSAYSADPGYLCSFSFGSAVQTAGGVFGTGGPRGFQFAVRINY